MAIEFRHDEWIDFLDRASAILPDWLTIELTFDSHSIHEDHYPELRDPSETAIFLIYKDGGGVIASRPVRETEWERDRVVYLIGLLQEMISDYVIEWDIVRDEVRILKDSRG